jgi:N-acetylmuramoyl-L-alanine amidase CwlA
MKPIKKALANKKNYGSTRSLSNIKYLVIHYTGNDGDTDESNSRYFQNNVTGTSAHYFVDDDSITQSVPDNFVAWHCGGKTYKHKLCRNANSIGIEICDDVRNGTIYPSAKTVANTLELTRYLMKKYNIPPSNVIRHYDVTGKLCPAFWCGTELRDGKWKTEFWNKLGVDNMVDVVKMIVDGKEIQVERILHNNTNYVKIRDVATAMNYNVSAKGSIPVLTKKNG